jgi:hypothetical protein
MKPWRLLVLLNLVAAAPVARGACDQPSLTAFVAAAQSLDKRAAALGEPLIKCPLAISERAVQWLAFYYYVSGDKQKSYGVDDRATKSAGGKGREFVLAQARAGNYQSLLRQVDDAEIGYGDAADAQLVLGRALVRDGKFQRGRQAYTAYLRLKPDDDVVEAEQLYSFVWEGNYQAAEARFNASATYRLEPEFAAAVKRGQALTRQQTKGLPPESGGPAPQAQVVVPGAYSFGHSLHLLKSVYRRQETALAYRGPVTLGVASHGISVQGLEDFDSRATQATIGADHAMGKTMRIVGKAGYFSPGEDHWFGDASFYLTMPAAFTYGIGAYKTPLALQLPLVQAEQDLMRQAGYFDFAWSDYILWRSEFRQEKAAAPHEFHEVIGRYPLWRGALPGEAVYVKVPMSLETHPKPSADYVTYPRTRRVGLGVDITKADASGWRLHLVSAYHLNFHQLRGRDAGTRRISTLAMDARLAYQAHQDVEVSVQGHYERSQEEALIDTTDKANFVGVGVVLSTD